TRKLLPRHASPLASDHGPEGLNPADAATPRRVGDLAPAPDRGQNTRGLASTPHRGLGAGKATLCCASPAIPHAASIPSTNPNSIGSTASEVVGTTAYRHRVTFAPLPGGSSSDASSWPKTNTHVISRKVAPCSCDQHPCQRGSPISCGRNRPEI